MFMSTNCVQIESELSPFDSSRRERFMKENFVSSWRIIPNFWLIISFSSSFGRFESASGFSEAAAPSA